MRIHVTEMSEQIMNNRHDHTVTATHFAKVNVQTADALTDYTADGTKQAGQPRMIAPVNIKGWPAARCKLELDQLQTPCI